MLAIIAPGQGSQTPGMLTAWIADPALEKLLAQWSSDIDLDDLNNLENELNNLVDDIPNTSSGGSYKPASDMFSAPSSIFNDDKPSVRFSDGGSSGVGRATSDLGGDAKTWDGYGKFNNVPINPDKGLPSQPQLTKEEMLREKFKFLRKLEALEKKGVELSKKYTMESSLQEMIENLVMISS